MSPRGKAARTPAFPSTGAGGTLTDVLAAVLFLVVGVAFLIATINSFRPVRRNKLFYVQSFFLSWLTNELAPFYLAIMLVITAGFIVWGDVLSYAVGWIGLVAMAATWVLLWVIHRGG